MFIRLEFEQKPKGKRGPPKTFIIVRCDIYGLEYKKTNHIEKIRNQLLHFHSKECMDIASQKGGVLALKKIETNLKHLGVAHPRQSNLVIEKSKRTCIERYGVDSPAKTIEVRQKIRNTNEARYGSPELFTTTSIKEKIKQTYQLKYGVDCHMKSDEMKIRLKNSFMARYGVDNPMKIESVKEKFDFKKSCRLAHETKKKNGTYSTSRAEQRFYECLVKDFGVDDIERFKLMNGWSIDFYIKSIDTYVQFDGVYWHGLDRPLEKIKEYRHERDKTIIHSFERDRRQDAWFLENNLKLIRVTDREFKVSQKLDMSLLITRSKGQV